MKPIFTLAIALALASSSLCLGEPALPTVPEVLLPLRAKILPAHWGFKFKGNVLEFAIEKPLTEEQWKALEELEIKLLVIGNAKGVDDAVLKRLAKMDLQGLLMDGSQFSDEGFRSIAKMKSLRSLSLFHPSFGKKSFTGKGFAFLKDLPDLEYLLLAGSSTGDSAVEAIGQLTQLKAFYTWHTQQSDPRQLYLLNLTNLRSLKLGNNLSKFDGKPRQPCLTEATLTTLAKLKSLETLQIMEIRPTYQSLAKLAALPHLKTLNLLESVDISKEDVEKLREKMPGVDIQWKALTEKEVKQLNDFLK